MATKQEASIPNEVPRYRITEKCYLNDRIYDPEAQPIDPNAEVEPGEEPPRKPLIISFRGVPAHYMEPVNEAAREKCKRHADRMEYAGSAIDSLTVVGSPAQPVAA